ncbi:MAG: PAS domain S-box protein, partial [Planctomycetia bacterium]|nr:PAS domain S-box protein [Planctomycetia bacterium]
ELPFTNKDLSIVKTFAVYASTAIKNANSHKALLYEIDERKKTETQLKESHDRYESIFNGAVDGIVYSDWEGKILSVNLAFTKLIGMKKADLIGKNGTQLVKQLLPKKSMMKKLKFIKNTVLKGEALKGLPIEYNNKSLEFYTRKEKGKPGVTVMVRDVTERNKARKNVELHQNNLATLSNELLVTEEEAKRRLATTLHDKLGQYLVLAKFKTDELNKKTADSENKKIIDEITSFIEEAINESRNITYELSPPILYEMGLIPAISLKLDDIEKSNEVKTSLIDQSKSYELEEKVQIILYRGINELLQNVLKHSKAESVNVSFKLLTNDYRITVRDNGIGLDLEAMRNKAVSQKKFGLFSIMERIKYIGGSVKIDTKPRKGTKVVINLPIKNL